jgi:hypothetical protein
VNHQQPTRTAPAPSPAVDGSPPVSPNLPRDEDARAARRVSQNILETLIFRGLSTPIALVLVVVQSRFLAPGGRGQFVLVVLSVTILSRLFGSLGSRSPTGCSSTAWTCAASSTAPLHSRCCSDSPAVRRS